MGPLCRGAGGPTVGAGFHRLLRVPRTQEAPVNIYIARCVLKALRILCGPFLYCCIHCCPFLYCCIHCGPFLYCCIHCCPFLYCYIHSGPFLYLCIHCGPFLYSLHPLWSVSLLFDP